MTALLLEMPIFCVRAGCGVGMSIYPYEHLSQASSVRDLRVTVTVVLTTHNLKTSGHMRTLADGMTALLMETFLCVV